MYTDILNKNGITYEEKIFNKCEICGNANFIILDDCVCDAMAFISDCPYCINRAICNKCHNEQTIKDN